MTYDISKLSKKNIENFYADLECGGELKSAKFYLDISDEVKSPEKIQKEQYGVNSFELPEISKDKEIFK